MKKKIKKHLALMLVIVLLIGIQPSICKAYTITTSGTSAIAPTNSQFKSAKSPKYFAKSEIINGTIAKAYDMDIYHYEAPAEGYYAIYTLGTLDTVGAVFEHQNIMMFTTEYKQVGYNDDGCVIGKGTSRRNCSMVVHMDKNEDFYICIRGYNGNTGSYTLYIEPNEDKRFNADGGIWKSMYVNNAAWRNSWTNQEIYLSPNRALTYYLLLDGIKLENHDKPTDFEYIRQQYNTSLSKAISTINILTGTVASLMGWSAPAAISIAVAGQLVSDIVNMNSSTQKSVRDQIKDTCEITGYGIVSGKQANVNYDIKTGVVIKDYFFANMIPCTMRSYEAFDCTKKNMTGEKYCYGAWE